ncbi:MAG: hypothetical protein QM820_04950 [Minicystis sp.]
MLNRIMLCAALLAPASAFAADEVPDDQAECSEDSSEKSICEQIGVNAFKCSQAWQICHWDPVDGRCERNPPTPGSGPLVGCSAIVNPFVCNAQPNCQWDAGDPLGPRCESL